MITLRNVIEVRCQGRQNGCFWRNEGAGRATTNALIMTRVLALLITTLITCSLQGAIAKSADTLQKEADKLETRAAKRASIAAAQQDKSVNAIDQGKKHTAAKHAKKAAAEKKQANKLAKQASKLEKKADKKLANEAK
jgi:hypothetical protein